MQLLRIQFLNRNPHSLDCDLSLGTATDNFLHSLRSHLQTGDNNFVNLVLRTETSDISIRTENAESVNDFATLSRVIFKKTNCLQMQFAIVHDFT